MDNVFAIAGSNDTNDGNPATTTLKTPGFMANEHPHECLNFWYSIKVRGLVHNFPKI